MVKEHHIPNNPDPAYVLLLKKPVEIYSDEFEGHQKSRFRKQIKKFVTSDTPESALKSESKFTTPLRQLKDRNAQVRGLGTWCDGTNFNLFVVQIIYDKDDESKIFPRQNSFSKRGNNLKNKFEPMTNKQIESKVQEWGNDSDLLIFTDDDF